MSRNRLPGVSRLRPFPHGFTTIWPSARCSLFRKRASGVRKGTFKVPLAIIFDDDRAHGVASRQAANPVTRGREFGRQFQAGWLGAANAPYTDWKWKRFDAAYCVPNLLRLPDGRISAAVGLNNKQDCIALCELELSTGKLKAHIELPVAVKNLSQTALHRQTAGLAYHDDRYLWVGFHARLNGKLCVHLANASLTQQVDCIVDSFAVRIIHPPEMDPIFGRHSDAGKGKLFRKRETGQTKTVRIHLVIRPRSQPLSFPTNDPSISFFSVALHRG